MEILLLLVAALVGAYLIRGRMGIAPKPGTTAPDFSLPDGDGRGQALSDYAGKRVALFFFPLDESPRTMAVVARFNALRSALEATRAEVIAVAVATCREVAAYADEYGMYFPILCDDGGTARAYGALRRRGRQRFARPMIVVIDAEGKIQQVFEDATDPTDVDALLKVLGK